MTAAPERKRQGRPALPPGAGKTARVELRVTPDTKAAWQAKADAAGLTLQTWIERAAAISRLRIAVESEREACAKACEDLTGDEGDEITNAVVTRCADAIRARGNP